MTGLDQIETDKVEDSMEDSNGNETDKDIDADIVVTVDNAEEKRDDEADADKEQGAWEAHIGTAVHFGGPFLYFFVSDDDVVKTKHGQTFVKWRKEVQGGSSME